MENVAGLPLEGISSIGAESSPKTSKCMLEETKLLKQEFGRQCHNSNDNENTGVSSSQHVDAIFRFPVGGFK